MSCECLNSLYLPDEKFRLLSEQSSGQILRELTQYASVAPETAMYEWSRDLFQCLFKINLSSTMKLWFGYVLLDLCGSKRGTVYRARKTVDVCTWGLAWIRDFTPYGEGLRMPLDVRTTHDAALYYLFIFQIWMRARFDNYLPSWATSTLWIAFVSISWSLRMRHTGVIVLLLESWFTRHCRMG